MNVRELIDRRTQLVDREQRMLDAAGRDGFTSEIRRDLDAIDKDIRELQGDLDRALRAEGRADADRPRRTDIPKNDPATGRATRATAPGEVRFVRKGETFARSDYSLPSGMKPSDLSVGRLVKAIATGDWTGADAERELMHESRAQSGVSSLGGYMLPSVLSDTFIDLARSKAVVASLSPVFEMTARDVTLARLDGDPSANWIAENQTITSSTASFGAIQMQAHKLACLVRSSIELVRDAPNASEVIENAMAAQVALVWDKAALRGSGSGQPLGVRYTSSVTVSTATSSTTFADIGNAIRSVRLANGEPNGLIWNPRTETTFGLLTDGQTQPLRAPSFVDQLPKYATTAVPNNSADGASTAYGSTSSTEIYVGDWSKLLLGVRSPIEIEVSNAGGGSDDVFGKYQLAIRCVMRGDVALAHEDHFAVVVGSTA